MAFEIRKIRLGNVSKNGTEKIIYVQLSNGVIKSVEQVLEHMNIGIEYYYITTYNIHAEIEPVYINERRSYIRTRGDGYSNDDLLKLANF